MSLTRDALQNKNDSSVGVDPQIAPIDIPVKNEKFPDKHVLLHIFIRELCCIVGYPDGLMRASAPTVSILQRTLY